MSHTDKPTNQERQMWPPGLIKYVEYLEKIEAGEAETVALDALRKIYRRMDRLEGFNAAINQICKDAFAEINSRI